MPSNQLNFQVTYDGQARNAQPLTVNGLNLHCHIADYSRPIIVMEFMALDRQAFWQAWHALGGDKQGICFEDGERFEAPFAPGSQKLASPKTFAQRASVVWAALWALLFPWTSEAIDD